MSYKADFARADEAFRQELLPVTDVQRMKLYGLSKQAKEGDCTLPMPPSSNVLLRAKWEAWTAQAGKSREKAMKEFIAIVEGSDHETIVPTPTRMSISMRNSILGPPPTPAVDHPILKEGKLFKQRDVFKGWRERYFVLQGSFLLYYLEADDPMPRKSMLVTGCTITDAKPSMVGQQVFYTFTLSHPKHPETYRLSSSSMETANEWVSALKAVAAEDSESILMENPMRQSEKLIPNSSQKKVFSTPMKETKENIPCSIKSNAEDNPVTNIATTETKPEDEYVAGLGGEEAEKIRKAVSTLLEVTGPNASGWEEMFEKNGVNAYKKAGSGAVCVRGDTIIPYHPFDVFRLLLDINRQSELDPQKVVSKKVKQLNQYTSYQYLKFKQIWPTAARDMAIMLHWRLNTDGTIIITSFSAPLDHLCPKDDSVVRAELILGGYVFKRHPRGTEIKYVVQVDLRGSIPSTIVNLVSSQQPMLVLTVKKVLERDFKGNIQPVSIDTAIDKEGLLEVINDGESKDVGVNSEVSSPARSVTDNTVMPDVSGKFVSKRRASGTASEINTPSTVRRASMSSATSSTKSNSNMTSRATIASTSRSSISVRPSISSLIGNLPEEEDGEKSEDDTSISARLRKARQSTKSAKKFIKTSLFILLLPFMFIYVVEGPLGTVFSIVSFLVAVRYIVKDHLGVPSRQPFGDIRCGKVPNGKFLFFFPIDLGNLLKYLDSKREKHSEITLVHITLKACAKVLLELPELNGQVIFNEFYPTMNGNIDVSMSHYNNEGDVVIIKVPDADKKDLNVIAAEVKRQADEERRGRYAYDGPRLFHSIPILSLLPTAVKIDLMQLCLYCGNYLGIEFEKVDVQAFPLGSCTVISSPNKKGETDMGVAVVPDHYATSTPVVVTISGIRIIPGLDFEKRVVGSPVLNCNVSINSYATTLPIARKFCSRLQELLAKPALLDEER